MAFGRPRSKRPLLIGRDDRFYLAAVLVFVCLMGSIWLGVTASIRHEREEMWHGLLETTAEDVSVDISGSMMTATVRLQGYAMRFVQDGGFSSPVAVKRAFTPDETGLLRHMRLIAADGTEVLADNSRTPTGEFKEIAAHYDDATEDIFECRHCRRDEDGEITMYQKIEDNGSVVGFLVADFNLGWQIGHWEDKVASRDGFLGIVDEHSRIFYFAGAEGASRYSRMVGNEKYGFTEALRKGESSFAYLKDAEGFSPVYVINERIGNSGWQVLLIMPEKVVDGGHFNAEELTRWALGFMEFGALLIFLLMGRHYFNQSRASRRGMDRMRMVIEGERVLFGAAQGKPEEIESAMATMAGLLDAKGFGFKVYADGKLEEKMYAWLDEHDNKLPLVDFFRQSTYLHDLFVNGAPDFIMRSKAELRTAMGSIVPDTLLPDNMVVVPLRGPDNQVTGILGAYGISDVDFTREVLHNLTLAFAGFVTTSRVYEKFKRMGERDTLTGLLNRNSFEEAVEELEGGDYRSLVCVYADANGLHHLNNTQGHDAGDRLICSVGQGLQGAFGDERTFRTGGDEFVAFVQDLDPAVVEASMRALQMSLRLRGYDSAFGLASADHKCDVRQLLRDAEMRMFSDKQSSKAPHRE